MSNLRLSAESSLFYQYNKNKAKKDQYSFVLSEHDSSESDQESDASASEGDSEPQDDSNEISPEVPHTKTRSKKQQMPVNGQENAAKLNNQGDGELQLKGSFTQRPATRQTASATGSTVKTNAKKPPPASKRGKKNAENLTETDNAPEPAAKRPRVAPKTNAISTKEPASAASTDHRDKVANISKIVDELETDAAAGRSPKSKRRPPKSADPTPRENKVSELGSPKTSKLRLLPEAAPLLRTPRRTLTLVEEFSPKRVEQSISDAEDVPDTELTKKSQKKTQPKTSTSRANEKLLENPIEETPTSTRKSFSDSSRKPLPTKQLQSHVKSSQRLNDPENDIYEDEKSIEETPLSKRRSFAESLKKPSPAKRLQSRVESSQQPNDPGNDIYGDDSELVEAVQKRNMLRSANSTNRQVPLRSAIETSTLPVPNRSPQRINFNLYLASLDDPIRAQELLSNAEFSITLIHLLPKMIFPLKINNPMLVMRLKGSVEFRSDPHTRSLISLNSSTRLVDLKAGRILHAVNTGEEVASFQLTEFSNSSIK